MEVERKPPSVVLGCMDFGRLTTEEDSIKMVDMYIKAGHNHLDTASMYAGGKSESILGRMAPAKTMYLASKANPKNGGLTPDGFKMQLMSSLKAAQRENFDLYYLHMPDHNTEIEKTLGAVQEMYKAGKFKELGLSNYSSWEVMEIYHIMKSKGWVLPTVYQGMYNALTRQVEFELFPCLRRLGIRFYAYNPLCGGVLTGKHKFEDVSSGTVMKGRYGDGGGAWVATYRKRFWRKEVFDIVEQLKKDLVEIYGEGKVSPTEASIRWMMHHSKMDSRDGIILGASKIHHLEQNLDFCTKGPLDERIVKIFDAGWEANKATCPCYFR